MVAFVLPWAPSPPSYPHTPTSPTYLPTPPHTPKERALLTSRPQAWDVTIQLFSCYTNYGPYQSVGSPNLSRKSSCIESKILAPFFYKTHIWSMGMHSFVSGLDKLWTAVTSHTLALMPLAALASLLPFGFLGHNLVTRPPWHPTSKCHILSL